MFARPVDALLRRPKSSVSKAAKRHHSFARSVAMRSARPPAYIPRPVWMLQQGVTVSGTYSPWLVCLSVFVAVFVSYTALNLAIRVSRASTTSARLWHAGGAVAMGGGIWSMHFIGMLAFSLPIPLAYDVGTTVASLAIAIAISGFAL